MNQGRYVVQEYKKEIKTWVDVIHCHSKDEAWEKKWKVLPRERGCGEKAFRVVERNDRIVG